MRKTFYNLWEDRDRTVECHQERQDTTTLRSKQDPEWIEAAIDEIETKIYNMGTREVETSVIGEMVMDKLKDLNEVAYVRFAAIYREFKDVNTFMSELKKLLK